jgi:hypothetical protein
MKVKVSTQMGCFGMLWNHHLEAIVRSGERAPEPT